ncbi:MAG: LysR family transcriptional regulator [Acetobacteraceae bacterium]|nr:LysR family transcriptional regulator [Acetobacteraceae bacterium]MDW8399812.1 LysR family transcriptional regulator [Acetobacteraceae bacterium]
MELRHLRYFVAVAEAGSVTAAAERLGLSQPPLSQQLRDLERSVGVPLFRREGRRLRLTEAGLVFLEGARRTLAAAQDATTATRRFALGEQGEMVLGATSSALLHGATPRLLGAFRRRHPLVRVEVEEAENHALVLALQERKADAVLLRIPVDGFEELAAVTIAEEEMLVAMPAAHPLSAAAGLSLAALAEEPVVLYRRAGGHGIYDALLAAFRRASFTPRVAEETRRLLWAVDLVAAGRGISFVPASMAVLHADLVVYRRLPAADLPRLPLNLAYNRRATPRSAERLVALAEEAARAACAAPPPPGAGEGGPRRPTRTPARSPRRG